MKALDNLIQDFEKLALQQLLCDGIPDPLGITESIVHIQHGFAPLPDFIGCQPVVSLEPQDHR
jgi:hypothetical protein